MNTNHRRMAPAKITGQGRPRKPVSAARLHQKVGPEHAFGGFEKARSRTSGNFYQRAVRAR